MRLGRYEIGRTVGEGSSGKVKLARRVDTGQTFAVKVWERRRVLALKIDDQIKREIGTLKLLKHPNVVRLYEVLASKTKIYMVLEYVDGGELFDKIATNDGLSEREARKLFQQLIDAVSYCHDKGVYHRDLKPENVLLDEQGNVKVADFGLSALPQQLGHDGLLHTTCGTPNYVAPEVIANRGYDGAKADIWSCGVILFTMLTGSLPFDDRNLAVLYQKIFKGETHIPKSLSAGARDLLRRILDPNPKTRISVDGIKAHKWFKKEYTPATPNDDDEDLSSDEEAFSVKEPFEMDDHGNVFHQINAFQLIGMSSSLDLSGFFEQEDLSERMVRFTSEYSSTELFERIEDIVATMGFHVQKGHGKLRVIQQSLAVTAEVFELSSSLYVVELRKLHGDSSLYHELCSRLVEDLGVCQRQQPPSSKLS